MKQIICPKCGPVKMYYRIEHLSRNVYYDADDNVTDVGDAQVTYEGVQKCAQCGRKIKIADPCLPLLDTIMQEIECTDETLEGFLMHPGTRDTVLAIINKYKEVANG